jgi:hypothetical protein
MKTIKTLLIRSLTLTLLLAAFHAYAADQSICQSGTNVVLHSNGSVKACQLKDTYDANGIRCKGESPATFYDNGQLESCSLYIQATIAGNKCQHDGLISFYSNGRLKSCMKPD